MTKSNNLLADYAAKKQDICIKNDTISDSLFREYGVNRGLRDVNGKGVLTGLTNISEIVSFKTGEDGSSVPCDGQLWYRGYNVKTLTNNLRPGEFGFEKIAYLLLFGQLPSESELAEFTEVLGRSRTLPTNFTRDVIMKAPSKDIMNSMTRSILTLASYDPLVAKAGIDNNIRQCLSLVAIFPMLAVYGYHAYNHYENDQSMYIHRPDPKLSTAENFLRMLRADNQYTELEARVLDMALILHMEHGGGNNSTFTTHVVTSSGTDSYSSTSASIGSLKGPRHGGAKLKVQNMFTDLKANVKDWESDEEITAYLQKILNKETPKGILGLSENSYMGIMNFVLLIPTWGWIISIIAWIVGKDKSEAVSTQGKYIFNWLISWSIYTLIIGLIFAGQFIGGIIGAIASPLSLLSGSLFNIGTLPFVLLFILYFVFPIIGGVKGLDGKLWKYPLSIPFLK